MLILFCSGGSPSANQSICGKLDFTFRITSAGPNDSACCPTTFSLELVVDKALEDGGANPKTPSSCATRAVSRTAKQANFLGVIAAVSSYVRSVEKSVLLLTAYEGVIVVVDTCKS
mmetsp:Transcript_25965/g.71245  ORF Transcript_25965/g.71245 Transcript_25965/m.71245 type:complete len:116 (-) Transcript_25965:75-422(-)